MKQKGILGILIIIVAIVIMFTWEAWGREKLIYNKIITFKESCEKNKVITKDMIKEVSVLDIPKGALKIENLSEILGMEANNFIPADCPLYMEFFEKKGLVMKEDQYILSIPNQWLMTIPQTLRRGDRVYFYSFDDNGKEKPKLLTSAIVAYSKDSANNEVNSIDPSRLQGSGNVSNIEVIVTKRDGEKLSGAIKDRYKLILMYR